MVHGNFLDLDTSITMVPVVGMLHKKLIAAFLLTLSLVVAIFGRKPQESE